MIPIAAERFNDVMKINAEAMQRLAVLAAENAGRVFRLQAETTRDMLATGSTQLRDLLSGEPTQLSSRWTQLCQSCVQRGLDLTRGYADSATEFQSDVMEVVGDVLPAISRNMFEGVASLATLPAGHGAEAASKPVAHQPVEPKAKKLVA